MKKTLFSLLLFFCCLSSCKNNVDSTYHLTYKGKNYPVEGARLLRNGYIKSTNLQTFSFYLYGGKISFNMEEIKGQGGFLKLELQTDSSRLRNADYSISNDTLNLSIIPGSINKAGEKIGSYFQYIPESKTNTDTIVAFLNSGKMYVSELDNEQQRFDIRFTNASKDSISGFFEGSYVFQNNTDGLKVGNIIIGDSIYDLQRGDLMLWGDIFVTGINYYELFFYSTSLRNTETGKFQKGLVFVLGINSSASNAPNNGTYALSKSIINQTALNGRKENNIDWGSYWYHYNSSTNYIKAFINKDYITLQRNGSKYDISFFCTDQLGDTIRGNYLSDFNIIDLR